MTLDQWFSSTVFSISDDPVTVLDITFEPIQIGMLLESHFVVTRHKGSPSIQSIAKKIPIRLRKHWFLRCSG